MRIVPAVLIALLCASFSYGQDTLPNFSVNNRGQNRILISWYNKFNVVKQISVQRSFDSLTNYKTILTVPDPMNRQNGFMDTKAPQENMFYRLYLLLDGGNFMVTKPQRPIDENLIMKVLQKSLTDSVLTPEEMVILKKYRDRIDTRRDTVKIEMNGGLKEKNATDIVLPSYRIFTNRDGNVRINLKDFDARKYSIKFYEEDNSLIFEIKEVKEPLLVLDKSNFHHSGWFHYELYDDGKVVERHRIYIPRDF